MTNTHEVTQGQEVIFYTQLFHL